LCSSRGEFLAFRTGIPGGPGHDKVTQQKVLAAPPVCAILNT